LIYKWLSISKLSRFLGPKLLKPYEVALRIFDPEFLIKREIKLIIDHLNFQEYLKKDHGIGND